MKFAFPHLMNDQSVLEAEFMIAFFSLMAQHPDPVEVLEKAKKTYEAVQNCEIDSVLFSCLKMLELRAFDKICFVSKLPRPFD